VHTQGRNTIRRVLRRAEVDVTGENPKVGDNIALTYIMDDLSRAQQPVAPRRVYSTAIVQGVVGEKATIEFFATRIPIRILWIDTFPVSGDLTWTIVEGEIATWDTGPTTSGRIIVGGSADQTGLLLGRLLKGNTVAFIPAPRLPGNILLEAIKDGGADYMTIPAGSGLRIQGDTDGVGLTLHIAWEEGDTA